MKTPLVFRVPGKPVPWKRTLGRGKSRPTHPAYKAHKALIGKHAWAACTRLGIRTPVEPGPLQLHARFVFARPKRMIPRKLGTASKADMLVYGEGFYPHTQVPDLDNLVKGVADALQDARVIEDDRFICRILASRYFGPLTEPVGYSEIVLSPMPLQLEE